jgi:hypothetical protein
MSKPHVSVFEMPNMGKIASVVMDQEDFDALCDDIEESLIRDIQSGVHVDIDTIRETKHLPLMGRGTKTEKYFNKFNVDKEINKMCAIVRGQGREVLSNARFGYTSPDMEHNDENI